MKVQQFDKQFMLQVSHHPSQISNLVRGMLFLLFFTIYSCGNTSEQKEPPEKIAEKNLKAQLKKIDSLEKIMGSQKTMNEYLGNQMIKAYSFFAESYPKDALTPEYLFRAADVAQGMGRGDVAYTYYQKIHSHYPKYKKARLSLFLQGFVSENMLQDTLMAKHIYEEVIKMMPGDDLSRQAQACIDNMGKSPDQLVKEWEKKNK